MVDCNLWQIITGSPRLSKCNLVSSETNLGTSAKKSKFEIIGDNSKQLGQEDVSTGTNSTSKIIKYLKLKKTSPEEEEEEERKWKKEQESPRTRGD